ncbi:MAG: DNA-binding transcriptional MocR family regulator, partial [Gammaproteobacteria bacterium]
FRNITNKEIFVTNGSVEGIYLLAHIFLKSGDTAAIEAIGFPPAIEAIRSTGASISPIRVDDGGLDPDDLEMKLQQTKIRLLYLTPLHQYPTTATLAIERRDVLCDAIDRLRDGGLAMDYRRPDGGVTIWLNTHSDSNELTRMGAA